MRRAESGGPVERERGARPVRVPAAFQGLADGGGDMLRPYGAGFGEQPVAGVGPVGGDDEGRARSLAAAASTAKVSGVQQRPWA